MNILTTYTLKYLRLNKKRTAVTILGVILSSALIYGLTALLYGLPIGIALSVFIYYQFGGVSTFAFTLPWGAIAACVLGTLAIVSVTMMVSGVMIRNDNIVDTIKEENV